MQIIFGPQLDLATFRIWCKKIKYFKLQKQVAEEYHIYHFLPKIKAENFTIWLTLEAIKRNFKQFFLDTNKCNNQIPLHTFYIRQNGCYNFCLIRPNANCLEILQPKQVKNILISLLWENSSRSPCLLW